MIVFIGCGKKKNTHTCEAKDMYLGSYFSTCLEYAKTLTNEENIYILSAKYGVLKLNDIISPYDVTLNKATKKEYEVWKNKVLNQLKELNITSDIPVTFLCGKNYYKELLSYFKDINIPLKDFIGMGYQISFMKKELNKDKPNRISLF